jgi:Flp pilus assembly protein TadB
MIRHVTMLFAFGKWEDKKERDANRRVARTETMWRSYMMAKEWGWWWTNPSGSNLDDGGSGSCCSFLILTSLDDTQYKFASGIISYYISNTISSSILFLFFASIVSVFLFSLMFVVVTLVCMYVCIHVVPLANVILIFFSTCLFLYSLYVLPVTINIIFLLLWHKSC